MKLGDVPFSVEIRVVGITGSRDHSVYMILSVAAIDAVDGSHHRHLGAKVRLLYEPLMSPVG